MYKLLCPLVMVLMALGAQAVLKDRCPWAVGKFPFDSSKFAGKWYVISCFSNLEEEREKKCATYDMLEFKGEGEFGFNVKYSAKGKDDKEVTYDGFSRTYKADKPSMFIGTWKKPHQEDYDGIYKQTLISTDYHNYAAFMACKPTFDKNTKKFGRHLMGSVLSRKPTLSEDIKKTLINVLSGYDMDITKITAIDHTDCKHEITKGHF